MLLTLVVLGFTLFLAYSLNQLRRPKNYPPGPQWLPFIGNVPQLKKLAIKLGGQHHAFSKMAKDLNTNVLGLKLGREYFVTVHSYPLVRATLCSEVYEGRPDNFFIRLRSFGTRLGVTCTDGPFWSEHRSFLMRHMRNLGYGKKSMEVKVQTEVDDILRILSNKEAVVELGPLFSVSVINVIWAVATGDRFSREDATLGRFLDLMKKRAKVFDMSGGILSQFPWLRFIMPERSGYNIIVNINKELTSFFRESIAEHHKTWYPDRQDDLIYTYITQMKAEGADTTFTEDQLIMVCLDLFIAGSNTTSSTLDFIFMAMLLYPDVQEKAAKYMDEIVPPNQPLTFADKVNLPYIEAIILEVQRFYTVAPLAGPRRVLRETTLEGYTIPKDATVLMSLESVHKDVEYWGDPNIFRPERFIDQDGNLLPADRVMNFGLGRRRCLGELIARQSIFMFFTSVLRRYKISVVPGTKAPSAKPIPGITMSLPTYKVHVAPRHPEIAAI